MYFIVYKRADARKMVGGGLVSGFFKKLHRIFSELEAYALKTERSMGPNKLREN